MISNIVEACSAILRPPPHLQQFPFTVCRRNVQNLAASAVANPRPKRAGMPCRGRGRDGFEAERSAAALF